MPEQPPHDETFPDDLLLIKGLGLQRWPGDAEIMLEVGDLEVTSVLAFRHGLFTFETRDRGHRSTTAVFGSARDARRYLIMDLGDEFRLNTRMAPVVMKELAPGTRLEEGPTGQHLTWPGARPPSPGPDETKPSPSAGWSTRIRPPSWRATGTSTANHSSTSG